MKSLTIEKLLQWAFTEELPKGGGIDGLANANSAWRMLFASSWGRMAEFAELLTLVDMDRGGSDFHVEQGPAHPDALAVGRAVAEIGRTAFVLIPDDWNPMVDWIAGDELLAHHLAPHVERARSQYRSRTEAKQGALVVSLVTRCAVLAQRPEWQADAPKLRMVMRGGKPAWFVAREVTDTFGGKSVIEVQGMNGRSHRPHQGAYRKLELSRDPLSDILGRLDYQLWVGALRRMEATLAGNLVAHRLEPWRCRMAPWQAATAVV